MKMLNDVGTNFSLQVALLVTQYQLNIELLCNSLWGQLPGHHMVVLSSPYHPNLAPRSLYNIYIRSLLHQGRSLWSLTQQVCHLFIVRLGVY